MEKFATDKDFKVWSFKLFKYLQFKLEVRVWQIWKVVKIYNSSLSSCNICSAIVHCCQRDGCYCSDDHPNMADTSLYLCPTYWDDCNCSYDHHVDASDCFRKKVTNICCGWKELQGNLNIATNFWVAVVIFYKAVEVLQNYFFLQKSTGLVNFQFFFYHYLYSWYYNFLSFIAWC